MADGILDRLRVTSMPPGFQSGGFDCGELELNEYLCDGTAQRDEDANLARTYLIHHNDDLVGYFSVLSDAIQLTHKERAGAPYSSAPAVKLGRMAVNERYQGQNIGAWVLDYVVGLARSLSKQVGVRYVTLDALNENLASWYTRYGFVRNRGEEERRKIIRWHFLQTPKEEALPHVSMRFDIMLEAELPHE